MSKFQLWSRDEYGQGSILMTSEDLDEVIKKAKEEVTKVNVNNALTATDRENNWEAYFIEVTSEGEVVDEAENDEEKIIFFYGGTQGLNHVFYSYNRGVKEVSKLKLENIYEAKVRAYLGNTSTSRHKEEDWFGLDARRNLIEKVDDPILEGKVKFFIQPV